MSRRFETRKTEKIIDELFCPEYQSLSVSIEEGYGVCTNQQCEVEGNVKKCNDRNCDNVMTD